MACWHPFGSGRVSRPAVFVWWNHAGIAGRQSCSPATRHCFLALKLPRQASGHAKHAELLKDEHKGIGWILQANTAAIHAVWHYRALPESLPGVLLHG